MTNQNDTTLQASDKNVTIQADMTTLSSQPYKGTRDYYPADKRIQNYIFDTWKQVVRSHGYEEYGAPMLEPLEVYTAKSGQELAGEQTYTFTDRGGRTVAIRPEMTPSISRMVAAQRQELGYPARLFSIANFMRYERPQRGREREFWQLNTDIFGVEGAIAEAEIIGLASEIMKAFSATDDMFTIKINNRKLINFMMAQYLGLDSPEALAMVKLFDRKDKISAEDFTAQAAAIFGEDLAESGLARVERLLDAKSMADLPEELRESSAVSEVQELFTLLEAAGVKNAIFDISLMRGLDYYTGTVFEVVDTDPQNNRSLFGGGRYDGLVGIFGAEPIPTVGMAPGLTTMELFLSTHSLLPELASSTDIGVIVLGDSLKGALTLAARLRELDVNIEVDISGRKLEKQMKAVLKKSVPFMLFVGEQELSDGVYSLKNTATEEELKLDLDGIAAAIKASRS